VVYVWHRDEGRKEGRKEVHPSLMCWLVGGGGGITIGQQTPQPNRSNIVSDLIHS